MKRLNQTVQGRGRKGGAAQSGDGGMNLPCSLPEWNDIEIEKEQWTEPNGGLYTDPEKFDEDIFSPYCVNLARPPEIFAPFKPSVVLPISEPAEAASPLERVLALRPVRSFDDPFHSSNPAAATRLARAQALKGVKPEQVAPDLLAPFKSAVSAIAAAAHFIPRGCYLWEQIHPQVPIAGTASRAPNSGAARGAAGVWRVPQTSSSGKYCIRLWVCGSWRKVYVDDRLPVDRCGTTLLPVTFGKELWPALLVKALLKVTPSIHAAALLCDPVAIICSLVGGCVPMVLRPSVPADAASLLALLQSLPGDQKLAHQHAEALLGTAPPPAGGGGGGGGGKDKAPAAPPPPAEPPFAILASLRGSAAAATSDAWLDGDYGAWGGADGATRISSDLAKGDEAETPRPVSPSTPRGVVQPLFGPAVELCAYACVAVRPHRQTVAVTMLSSVGPLVGVPTIHADEGDATASDDGSVSDEEDEAVEGSQGTSDDDGEGATAGAGPRGRGVADPSQVVVEESALAAAVATAAGGGGAAATAAPSGGGAAAPAADGAAVADDTASSRATAGVVASMALSNSFEVTFETLVQRFASITIILPTRSVFLFDPAPLTGPLVHPPPLPPLRSLNRRLLAEYAAADSAAACGLSMGGASAAGQATGALMSASPSASGIGHMPTVTRYIEVVASKGAGGGSVPICLVAASAYDGVPPLTGLSGVTLLGVLQDPRSVLGGPPTTGRHGSGAPSHIARVPSAGTVAHTADVDVGALDVRISLEQPFATPPTLPLARVVNQRVLARSNTEVLWVGAAPAGSVVRLDFVSCPPQVTLFVSPDAPLLSYAAALKDVYNAARYVHNVPLQAPPTPLVKYEVVAAPPQKAGNDATGRHGRAAAPPPEPPKASVKAEELVRVAAYAALEGELRWHILTRRHISFKQATNLTASCTVAAPEGCTSADTDEVIGSLAWASARLHCLAIDLDDGTVIRHGVSGILPPTTLQPNRNGYALVLACLLASTHVGGVSGSIDLSSSTILPTPPTSPTPAANRRDPSRRLSLEVNAAAGSTMDAATLAGDARRLPVVRSSVLVAPPPDRFDPKPPVMCAAVAGGAPPGGGCVVGTVVLHVPEAATASFSGLARLADGTRVAVGLTVARANDGPGEPQVLVSLPVPATPPPGGIFIPNVSLGHEPNNAPARTLADVPGKRSGLHSASHTYTIQLHISQALATRLADEAAERAKGRIERLRAEQIARGGSVGSLVGSTVEAAASHMPFERTSGNPSVLSWCVYVTSTSPRTVAEPDTSLSEGAVAAAAKWAKRVADIPGIGPPPSDPRTSSKPPAGVRNDTPTPAELAHRASYGMAARAAFLDNVVGVAQDFTPNNPSVGTLSFVAPPTGKDVKEVIGRLPAGPSASVDVAPVFTAERFAAEFGENSLAALLPSGLGGSETTVPVPPAGPTSPAASPGAAASGGQPKAPAAPSSAVVSSALKEVDATPTADLQKHCETVLHDAGVKSATQFAKVHAAATEACAAVFVAAREISATYEMVAKDKQKK